MTTQVPAKPEHGRDEDFVQVIGVSETGAPESCKKQACTLSVADREGLIEKWQKYQDHAGVHLHTAQENGQRVRYLSTNPGPCMTVNLHCRDLPGTKLV